MKRIRRVSFCLWTIVVTGSISPVWAVDSYRYLHVTIDTPWSIFLFLLPIVLSPFILMAILYWRFAGRRREQDRLRSQEQIKSRSGDS